MNNKIYFLIFLIFGFLSFSKAHSQLLSLEESISIALENNYSINISKSRAEIINNNVSYGNAGFLPFLDLSGRLNKSSETVQQEYLDGRTVNRDWASSDLTSAQIELNWTIFDGMKMFSTYDKLGLMSEMSLNELKAQVELTVSEVIVQYQRVILQNKVIDVANENVSISEERLRIMAEKFDLGSSSKMDKLQAEVDLNADLAYLYEQENILSNLKIRFNELLNRSKTAEFEPEGEISFDSEIMIDDLLETLTNDNVYLHTARMSQEINKLEIEEIRSEYYPRLSIFSNYRYSKSESESGFLTSNRLNGYSYGLNLSMNLYNGNNTQRRIENLKLESKIKELEYNQIESEIQSVLMQTYNDYVKNIRLVELEVNNLDVSQENLAIAVEQLKLGVLSPIELREAQRSYVAAQSRLLNAQFLAKFQEIELNRLSGNLIKGINYNGN